MRRCSLLIIILNFILLQHINNKASSHFIIIITRTKIPFGCDDYHHRRGRTRAGSLFIAAIQQKDGYEKRIVVNHRTKGCPPRRTECRENMHSLEVRGRYI